eukprot:3721048-Rhodomonas_salina.1
MNLKGPMVCGNPVLQTNIAAARADKGQGRQLPCACRTLSRAEADVTGETTDAGQVRPRSWASWKEGSGISLLDEERLLHGGLRCLPLPG